MPLVALAIDITHCDAMNLLGALRRALRCLPCADRDPERRDRRDLEARHPLRAPRPCPLGELRIACGCDPIPRGWRLSISPSPEAYPPLDAGLLCRKLWSGGGHPCRAGATLPKLPAWLLPPAVTSAP